jgi:hypothetical protein
VPFFFAWEKLHLCMIDSAEANSEKMSTTSCRYYSAPATEEVDKIMRKK